MELARLLDSYRNITSPSLILYIDTTLFGLQIEEAAPDNDTRPIWIPKQIEDVSKNSAVQSQAKT